jgi:hypothetical protein
VTMNSRGELDSNRARSVVSLRRKTSSMTCGARAAVGPGIRSAQNPPKENR